MNSQKDNNAKTSRRAAASRMNGAKSCGPITRAGKEKSSRNALKHGLLSREIKLPPDEAREFQLLREAVLHELRPSGVLQTFFADEIAVGMLKCKLALRAELRELKRGVQGLPDGNPGAVGTRSNEPAVQLEPIYCDTAYRLHRKLKLLDELRSEIHATGHISPQRKTAIFDAFGENFCAVLEQWRPADPMMLLMVENIVKKCETCGMKLPVQATAEQLAEQQKVQQAFEGPLKQQATVLIVEREMSHVRQILATHDCCRNEIETSESDPLDRFLRYATTIRRELRRALTRYFELKAALAENASV